MNKLFCKNHAKEAEFVQSHSIRIYWDEDPAIRLLEWLECEIRCPRQRATQGCPNFGAANIRDPDLNILSMSPLKDTIKITVYFKKKTLTYSTGK